MSFRLVVIDDDDDDRYLVRRVARKWDRAVVVDEISSARAALERFGKPGRADDEGDGLAPPSVILLDINMPEMSGFELLERLEGHIDVVHDIPPVVVMLSSSSNTRDVERAHATGVVADFIVKPLTAADLDRIADLRASLGADRPTGPLRPRPPGRPDSA